METRTILEETFSIKHSELVETVDPEDWANDVHVHPWIEKLKEDWIVKMYTTQISPDNLGAGVYRIYVEAEVEPKWRENECHNCGRDIEISIFRGGNFCSDDCRKMLGDDIP